MPLAKKYKAAIALYDRDEQFTPTEAVELVKKTASAKFDETVDVAIRLGVDPRKADQTVRGTVALPAGTGKTMRIAVVAAGEAANEARAAGADLVGADDLAAEIEKGNMDFDLMIATPDMISRAEKWSTAPTVTAMCTCVSVRHHSALQISSETCAPCLMRFSAQSPHLQRASTCARSLFRRPWALASRSTSTGCVQPSEP